ncbi:MAG: peptidoglycan DD-metalloendopeptidase family protein [Gemmatimonadetes bacterium]|nr:peptidoglycan DD-metalloendopeptidase family protein [Gemmatimonadota bacterium]NIO32600.1 peptidoglycan DD-metalloendopeptidase family protein [Gemmatimonadota bacterium]
MRRSALAPLRACSHAALAALALAGPAMGQEDPIAPLEEQIRLSRQQLAAIRDEQRRLRNEMDALSAQIHDVSAELENLNQQARNQEALLREMDHQLALRDQQVVATTSDLLRTQDQLVEKEVLFARRARDLYVRGPLANWQVLLAAENFSDLINRYQYLYLVALYDRLLVKQIENLKDLLEEQYDMLRREVQGLRETRSEKVREIQDLYLLERERGRRLRTVRGQQATTARQLEELELAETELTGLVGRLEREREAAEALAAASPTASTLAPEDRGTLSWPVQGRVIYGFGQQRNPDGTRIIRQGMGIAAAEQTEVKAVATGTVAFAQPYLSYGPSVILSHGGGYYTVYLYLSEILVREGELVATGQVLGRVGGADTPEGPHLEFQIRVNREAVDPRPWLRGPGG